MAYGTQPASSYFRTVSESKKFSPEGVKMSSAAIRGLKVIITIVERCTSKQ